MQVKTNGNYLTLNLSLSNLNYKIYDPKLLKASNNQNAPRHSFDALAHAGEISKIAKTGFITCPIVTK